MVRNLDQPPGGTHRLPGLPADLKRTYEALLRLGATGPSGGRDLRYLSKQLHESRHGLEHELHVLEGKGVVGHQTSGHETVWFARR